MLQLVCLPGLLCTAGVYDRLRDVLDVDVLALDLPQADTFDVIVAEIVAQLPVRAVLVGMSMGSYLALAIARQAPEKIAGLVLIGTNTAADSPRAAALRGKVAAWAAREGIPALAGSIADSMLSDTRRADPILRDAILTMAEATGLDTFTAHQAALAGRPDQTAALSEITCPVLVLTGAEDMITPPEAGRSVANSVADGQFVLLEGVGHMPVLEVPDTVAHHLKPFLTELTSRETA